MQTEVLNLLTKKNDCLLQIQQISEEMSTIDASKLEDCMNRREEIIEQIQKIDSEVQKFPEIETLKKLFVKSGSTRQEDELTEEERKAVYLMRQGSRLAGSIIEQDRFAQDRVRQEQKYLLEQIKKRNKPQTAANGYYKTLNTGVKKIFEPRDLGKI